MSDPLDPEPAPTRGILVFVPQPDGSLDHEPARTPNAALPTAPTASEPSEREQPHQGQNGAIGLAGSGDIGNASADEIDIAQLQDEPLEVDAPIEPAGDAAEPSATVDAWPDSAHAEEGKHRKDVAAAVRVDASPGGEFGVASTEVIGIAQPQAKPTGPRWDDRGVARLLQRVAQPQAKPTGPPDEPPPLSPPSPNQQQTTPAHEAAGEAARQAWLAAEEERLTTRAEQLRAVAEQLRAQVQQLAARAKQLAVEEKRLAARAEQLAVEAERLAAEKREQEKRLAARAEQLAAEAERLAAEKREQEKRLAAQWQRQAQEELQRQRAARHKREEEQREAQRKWEERKKNLVALRKRWVLKQQEWERKALGMVLALARWLLRITDGVFRKLLLRRQERRVRALLVSVRLGLRKVDRVFRGWSEHVKQSPAGGPTTGNTK